jgi:hypothetical protein
LHVSGHVSLLCLIAGLTFVHKNATRLHIVLRRAGD